MEKLSEEYLQQCQDCGFSADPTQQDVVIKDLKKRLDTLVNHIRVLQSNELDRDENSTMGRVTIGFQIWLDRTNMRQTTIPFTIKYRMYIDKLIAKRNVQEKMKQYRKDNEK